MSGAPVLILSGPPGAGKTTTAGIVAARAPRTVHLESDAFFHFVRSGYVEPWRREAHAQNEVVMAAVADAARRYADAGYLTIVEGIVIPGWFFEPLRAALAAAGHEAAFAVLRPPLDVCLARSTAERAAVEQLWRAFADLGPLEPHAIDPGDRSPDEVADLVLERVEARTPPAGFEPAT